MHQTKTPSRIKYALIITIFLLVFTVVTRNADAAGAVYYVAVNGSDSNAGSSAAPFATFTKAFSTMAVGDTLIVKDGTYNQTLSNPPNGTVAAYTVIRAENDGKAIINGGGNGSVVNLNGRNYIRIEGLKITNGYDDGISINNGQYIKILRNSIVDGPAATNEYGAAMDISNSSYILVEDNFIYGRFRYGFQAYGWTAGTGNQKLIFRRNVARFDGMQTTQPIAAYMVYGHSDYLNTQDILYQNNIAFDFTAPPNANIQNGFSSDKIWQNVIYEGNVVLNLGTSWNGFAGSGYGGATGKAYVNNLAIGVNTAFRAAGTNYFVNQATVSNADAGFETYGDGSYDNSLFLNGGANINGYGSYSDFSGTPLQSGTGNRSNNPNLQYLLRATDTGTGDAGAKRGATIEKQYGASGTLWGEAGYDQLTTNSLWPFPNESRIRSEMCSNTSRGWCQTSKTLTQYLWEYLGNVCPADICGGSQPPPPAPPPADTTPPAVSISLPASGATVSGTITVSANASDNVGVAGVQFKLDGTNLGAEDMALPYSISWNTATVGNGSHILTATARDAAGNTATSVAVAVTVTNVMPDTIAPSVPTGLTATVASSGRINLSWTASTDNVGVAGYKIYRNGVQVGSPTTSLSYQDTGLSASTAYSYTVLAYDAAGNNSAQSGAATATTQATAVADTTPPSVSISAPVSGATVSATVAVSANASDNVGVAGVQFLIDNQNLGGVDASSPYSVSWNTTSIANGSHSITAIASDTSGNTATSQPVVVTVTNQVMQAPIPPTISGGGGGDGGGGISPAPTPTLSVTLTSSRVSGNAPFKIDLTANVGGSAQGPMNYTFYCDRSDAGANIIFGYDFRFYQTQENPKVVSSACSYERSGIYTPKVIVNRDSATPVESHVTITVSDITPNAGSGNSGRRGSADGSNQGATTPLTQENQFITKFLFRGIHNDQVKILQLVLFKDGETSVGSLTTGFFGRLTEEALKQFQAKYGIITSGNAFTTGYGATGPSTRSKINQIISGSQTTAPTPTQVQSEPVQPRIQPTVPVQNQKLIDMQNQLQSLLNQLKILQEQLRILRGQ